MTTAAGVLAMGLLAGLSTPDRTVEQLVEGLALSKVTGLRFSEPMAVHAAATERDVAERVVGRLRARGVQHVFVVSGPADDARSTAQDRGARWLLEIRRTPTVLRASLREVDGGLWRAPASGVFSSASVMTDLIAFDPKLPADLGDATAVGPNPVPGLYGPMQPIATLAGEPLALASCPDEPPSLLVLTRHRLYRARWTDGWQVDAQLELDPLARHPTPSRFPIGVVTCTLDRIGVATSDLETGHEVDPIGLTVRASLAGAPLAAENRGWRLGTLHQGTAAWMGPDGVLIWSHPGGRVETVLVAEGALHHQGAPLGPSGIGASAVVHEDHLVWVRTGLSPWGTADEIQLGIDNRLVGEPVAFSTSVRATALGRFTDDTWALIVAVPADGQTVLSALRVVLP